MYMNVEIPNNTLTGFVTHSAERLFSPKFSYVTIVPRVNTWIYYNCYSS